MSKQHIHIGVEDANRGYKRFLDAWHNAEVDKTEGAEMHLNFEDFAMLTAILTPKRLELMKALRQHGPLSVRALAKQLKRDYKNVHVEVFKIEMHFRSFCLIDPGFMPGIDKSLKPTIRVFNTNIFTCKIKFFIIPA